MSQTRQLSSKTKFVVRDAHGYISRYDYKANREPLDRARAWRSLASVEKYLLTDSYRRLAKHTHSNLVIQEIEELEEEVAYSDDLLYTYQRTRRLVLGTVRTIPQAAVASAAAQASTRAERRARGLKR